MSWTITQTFIPGAHFGVDLANGCGAPIHAIAGGTVAYAADSRIDQAAPAWTGTAVGRSMGIVVAVAVGGGRLETYGHMSRLGVSKGQPVSAGQVIGYVGATGYAFGCHCHFGVLDGSTWVDPLSIFTRAQLLAGIAGADVTLASSTGGADPATVAKRLAALASLGISTDPAHVITAAEAKAIADKLYNISPGGDVEAAIIRTLTGMTVGEFTTATGTINTSVDPLTAIANAISGVPSAIGSVLTSVAWLLAIFVLVALGLYLTLAPSGGST